MKLSKSLEVAKAGLEFLINEQKKQLKNMELGIKEMEEAVVSISVEIPLAIKNEKESSEA